MRVESSFKKGFVYLLLASVPIIFSTLYGQLMESNIGGFKDYGTFGSSMSLWLIILIPVLITIYYIALIAFATKSGLLKWNIKHTSFLLILVLMVVYMSLIIATKDITHSFSPNFVNSNNLPTFNERLWSIFSFYLGLLTIYNILFLIRPVKGHRFFIALFCIGVIIFALSSIAYSLIAEWDKYVNFEGFDDLYQKPDLSLVIKSFFDVANVFGHTVYLGILALVTLSFVFRKYYLVLFSLLLVPFIFYSNCRIALVGTFILYIAYFIYLWIRSFHYCRKLFYVLTIIFAIGLIALVVDFTLYNFIKFDLSDGSEVSLKKVVLDLVKTFYEKRIGILTMIPVTSNDILLGFGYGLQFIVPRTYGYYYYFHNAVYEIFMAGGLPYFIFYLVVFCIVFVKLIMVAIKKRKYNLLGLFLVILSAQIVYGLFESHVALFNDFTGLMLGIFLVAIPNMEAEFALNSYRPVYFNSEIQKSCLRLSYKELFTQTFAEEDLALKETLEFVKKRVVELNIDETWSFVITYKENDTFLQNAYFKFDSLEHVCYVNFNDSSSC